MDVAVIGLALDMAGSLGDPIADHEVVMEVAMRYAVLIEPVTEAGFEGYYYAHVPSLDLTTHGMGIEGALQAAQELAEAWVAERRAHGEVVPTERNSVIAQIEVADAVLRP